MQEAGRARYTLDRSPLNNLYASQLASAWISLRRLPNKRRKEMNNLFLSLFLLWKDVSFVQPSACVVHNFCPALCSKILWWNAAAGYRMRPRQHIWINVIKRGLTQVLYIDPTTQNKSVSHFGHYKCLTGQNIWINEVFRLSVYCDAVNSSEVVDLFNIPKKLDVSGV